MYNCIFCKNSSLSSIKCTICHCPLSEDIDYFDLFSLKRQFSINKIELYKSFLTMQQKFHPDKFLNNSKANLQFSEKISTLINHAFNLLNDDRKRGEYLLSQANIYVNSDHDNIKPDLLMLEEVFTQSEILSDVEDIQIIKLELNKIQKIISDYFNKFSRHYEQELFSEAAQNLIAIKYYQKLIAEIQLKLG